MTRERAKELLPVIQAFAEGKDVEVLPLGFGLWTKLIDPRWNDGHQYRIKPEPRRMTLYRLGDGKWHESGAGSIIFEKIEVVEVVK